MKKRLLSLLLALLMLLPVLTACSQEAVDTAMDIISEVLAEDSGENGSAGGQENSANPLPSSHSAEKTAVPSLPDKTAEPVEKPAAEPEGPVQIEDGPVYGERYSSKDDVAAYLHAYGELPPNFIKKSKAQDLGWDSSLGNLWQVTDGMSIGGDRFGNYEGLLPDKKGRTYYECDINYDGGYRGAERIIYSSDGLIYYTNDHYKTFTLLYGNPD